MSSVQQRAVMIALLCNKINGINLTCTADSLATAAQCYMGMSPIQQNAVIIYLLCQLNAAIPGSSGGNFSGTGSPEGVVTAPVSSTYLQIDTGSFWMKRTGTGNTGWIEIVA